MPKVTFDSTADLFVSEEEVQLISEQTVAAGKWRLDHILIEIDVAQLGRLAGIDGQAEMLEHSLLLVADTLFQDGAVVGDGPGQDILVRIDFFHQLPEVTWPTRATFSGSMLSARVTSEPMRMGMREAAGDWFSTTALSESE